MRRRPRGSRLSSEKRSRSGVQRGERERKQKGSERERGRRAFLNPFSCTSPGMPAIWHRAVIPYDYEDDDVGGGAPGSSVCARGGACHEVPPPPHFTESCMHRHSAGSPPRRHFSSCPPASKSTYNSAYLSYSPRRDYPCVTVAAPVAANKLRTKGWLTTRTRERRAPE